MSKTISKILDFHRKTCTWPTSGLAEIVLIELVRQPFTLADNISQQTSYLGRHPWYLVDGFSLHLDLLILADNKNWPKLALTVIFLENFTSKTPFKIQFLTYLGFWNLEKAWKLQFLWYDLMTLLIYFHIQNASYQCRPR